MILFNEKEWSIAVPPGESIFARQYDHLSRDIVVEGAPSDWQFYMLVETSGHHDTIFLSPVQNGIGVTLTREMLSFSGAYYIQLKGVKDEIERHTNVVQTYIPSSLSGEADWPDIPSEFEQIEQRIHELNTHPPYPGDGGFWMVWDVDRNEYFQSELPLPPVAVGPPGQAATIRIKETVTGESGTEAKVENLGNENAAVLRFTIPMGEPGPTGKTPDISVEVSSLSSDSEPTVNITGTPENPVIAIGVPRGQDGAKGDPGDKGDPGSPGQTPNITIGIVETLPEGSEVTASITGETPNLILNLGIPKGRDGTEGAPGQAATIQITETETVSSDTPAAIVELSNSTPQNRKYKAQIPKGEKGDQGLAGNGLPSTDTAENGYVPTFRDGVIEWEPPSDGEKNWTLIEKVTIEEETSKLVFNNSGYSEFMIFINPLSNITGNMWKRLFVSDASTGVSSDYLLFEDYVGYNTNKQISIHAYPVGNAFYAADYGITDGTYQNPLARKCEKAQVEQKPYIHFFNQGKFHPNDVFEIWGR